MQTQDFEKISSQIEILSNKLKESIKTMGSGCVVLAKENKNTDNDNFHLFIEGASSLLSAPVDFKPLISQKYKKQHDQITKLQAQLQRFNNDIEVLSKKFNESVEDEKIKFNRLINNLANNYYDQREMHSSNHEAQISNFEDASFELKANYEAKLSDGLKKVAAEKKLLKKLYKTIQKNYNDMKINVENNLPETNIQICTDNDENEKDSNKKNYDENDDYNDNNNDNDATGSSEVKTRAYMGNILNKIDEIEEVERENKKLADQIEAMKAKNEAEIVQLKNQLSQIETSTEAQLNNALRSNQEKYDTEFETIKTKYAQIEGDLIKKLNALKKEQSSANNDLRTELSKVKAMSNSCKVKMSKRIKEAESISESKIQEKKMEMQNLKIEHSKAIEELMKNDQDQIHSENALNSCSSSNSQSSIRRKLSHSKIKVTQPQIPQTLHAPRRSKITNQDDEKVDALDIKSLMEKINFHENESRQKSAQYSDFKNSIQKKISQDELESSSQVSEIEKETEVAQNELNELLQNLEELQKSLAAAVEANETEKQQKDEINNKKDEINRRRVIVSKRKILQAVQSRHHQEIDQIDDDIRNLIQDSISQIQQKSDNLLDEQKNTDDALAESSAKLEAILNKLKEAKNEEEDVIIKERQKWGDIRRNIANSTIDLCNQSKNTSRPTSSVAQSRPISKLPPLQKSQS